MKIIVQELLEFILKDMFSVAEVKLGLAPLGPR